MSASICCAVRVSRERSVGSACTTALFSFEALPPNSASRRCMDGLALFSFLGCILGPLCDLLVPGSRLWVREIHQQKVRRQGDHLLSPCVTVCAEGCEPFTKGGDIARDREFELPAPLLECGLRVLVPAHGKCQLKHQTRKKKVKKVKKQRSKGKKHWNSAEKEKKQEEEKKKKRLRENENEKEKKKRLTTYNTAPRAAHLHPDGPGTGEVRLGCRTRAESPSCA